MSLPLGIYLVMLLGPNAGTIVLAAIIGVILFVSIYFYVTFVAPMSDPPKHENRPNSKRDDVYPRDFDI